MDGPPLFFTCFALPLVNMKLVGSYPILNIAAAQGKAIFGSKIVGGGS